MARTALYFFLLTTIIGCKSTIKFTISAQDVVSPVFVAKKIDIQYEGVGIYDRSKPIKHSNEFPK